MPIEPMDDPRKVSIVDIAYGCAAVLAFLIGFYIFASIASTVLAPMIERMVR